MTASIRRIAAVTIACFLFAVLRCSPLRTVDIGGTGSETVIGRIVNEDGTPARGTVVSLRPYNFNPVSDHMPSDYGVGITDSDGRYAITIDSPTVKIFILQAVSLQQRTRTLMPDIDLSPPRESVVIETAILHKTGSIKVILSDSSISGNGYVFIPGTSMSAYLESGYAIIDSVPAETIPHVYYSENNDFSPPRSLADSVAVKPGIATIVAFSGSAHAAKIRLNTTPGGAGVAENVYGFPLLIRVSSAHFVFGEARTDGSDIRFTKSDNTPLPFEIERWDAAARLAEIWVKVDTVYGNDSSHFLVMYWGEPATAIVRNSAKVFDTTGGFRGVWHLGEEASGVGNRGIYKDATGRNDGDDYVSATDRSGVIGYGHAFNGTGDYILVNNPVTNFLKGDLTIGVWVNIHDSGGTILSKLDSTLKWDKGASSFYFGDGTDAHLNGFNPSHLSNGSYPSFVGFGDDYNIAGQPVASDDWHYLAYTWKWNGDNTGMPKYYIDGIEVPLARDSLVVGADENVNAVLRIGQPNNNESNAFFKGLMDELEISAVTRSAGWVKLCYVNQRKENSLVKF